MREVTVKHGTVLVDDDDFERISQYRWFSYRRRDSLNYFYAIARPRVNGKRLNILLHRFIMNAEAGQIIDHVNRNGLDCQRSNLRFCTPAQNSFNRKPNGSRKYKGITRDSRYRSRPWKAKIVLGGKAICLGMFATQEEAAEAYRLKAVEVAGEFARQEPAELPDLPLSEQLRLEEEAAAEEGAAIEASGYPDPAENVRFA